MIYKSDQTENISPETLIDKTFSSVVMDFRLLFVCLFGLVKCVLLLMIFMLEVFILDTYLYVLFLLYTCKNYLPSIQRDE